jgi:hypothetical protein
METMELRIATRVVDRKFSDWLKEQIQGKKVFFMPGICWNSKEILFSRV